MARENSSPHEVRFTAYESPRSSNPAEREPGFGSKPTTRFGPTTPKRERMPAILTLWEAPSQEALADHDDNQPPQIRQAGGYCSADQDGFRRVADGLSLG